MNATKFTPGPWDSKRAKTPTDGAYDWGVGALVNGKGQCIAEAFGRTGETDYPPAEANAALIAAAPDLYAALERVMAVMEAGGIFDPKAIAALAKARGEGGQ